MPLLQTRSHSSSLTRPTYNANDTFIPSPHAPSRWARGVNIGGWLVLERYITPYMFSITDCHIRGDLCWFPGQLSAPPENEQLCHLYRCSPYQTTNVFGDMDYPMDEWSLAEAFRNSTLAAEWLNHHFDKFVTRDNVQTLAEFGVTHVRVPLPHWILGNVLMDEPWVPADRWHYFLRFLDWCREYDIQVWPDLHTAPGSQNGFDNSGQAQATGSSCLGWSRKPEHVARTLEAIRDITRNIKQAGYSDVVTGFGLLNEPFKDCDKHIYQAFVNAGLEIVRQELGQGTHVYISDMFLAKTFNSGFWTDPHKYQNTYLDSHYYHVFEEVPRALSPRQHIAFVCTNERRDVVSCCYDDYPVNLIPSDGIQRMVGEWSVATDTLPATMLKYMLESIAKTGIAADFDRTLSPERQGFLKHFAQAQMVAYESADVGTSSAWFYWNFKMEGGGFAEWDYLRGINEGWIPRIPSSDTPSTQVYGTCYDILFRTNDTMDIIHEYPDPATPGIWIGAPIDDDVVLSHGQSLLPRGSRVPITPIRHGHTPHWIWALFTVALFVLVWKLAKWKKRRKTQYMRIDSEVGISA